MRIFRIPLRVVFYRENGDWIAHCLEFDLAGDGRNKDAALSSLSTAIGIQVENSVKAGNFANLFTPADGDYFRMFAEGKDTTVGEIHLDANPIQVERTEYREYSDADNELIPA